MGFTFNGTSCETYDMHVEAYPVRPIPMRKQTIYKVPGRSGDLIVDEDAYENVQQEYEVYVNHATGNMQNNLIKIAKWLLEPSGYCELTDTYDSNIKRMARFVGGMSFINSLNKYGKATAVFDCKPQRWPVADPPRTGFLTENAPVMLFITEPNMLAGYPLLEITNVAANNSLVIESGTLRIVIPARGTAISKIVVDWETQSVYNAYNNSVPSNTTVTGEWAKIGDGDTITITNQSGPDMGYKMYRRMYYI